MYKIGRILELVRDSDVLDIGSVGQTESYNMWAAYNEIKLKSLTGIDLPGVKDETKKVFDRTVSDEDARIVFGDMETYTFDRQFDFIVAGDVLEHVNNQGLFLSNIRKHLRDSGKFILTTPNAKWLTVILKPNPTHTCWHDRYTLERILSMNGLRICEFKYYLGNKKRYIFPKNILARRQAMFAVCEKI